MKHIDFLSATERGAIAAYSLVGRGLEHDADQAAVTAMRGALNQLDIKGKIVIGEGERDEAPMLYIGEEVGVDGGVPTDIAVDPLEGTTLCARGDRGSLSVLAAGEAGKFLHAPDVYMNKIAVGPKARDAIHIERSVEENCRNVADALSKNLSDLCVMVLDRPRHEKIIRNLRDLGSKVILIRDGDVSAAILTCIEDSGIDMMMGVGGSPEGVLAAAALKCLGGNIQGILQFNKDEEKERAFRLGITEFHKVYSLEDMVSGDVVFCATGVTSGDLLQGISIQGSVLKTHSLVMRSKDYSLSRITTEYPKERWIHG